MSLFRGCGLISGGETPLTLLIPKLLFGTYSNVLNVRMSSFQGVGTLYTEVFSFQGVGIEWFHLKRIMEYLYSNHLK